MFLKDSYAVLRRIALMLRTLVRRAFRLVMVRAIPTHYKGITFRSRLEASWAGYFDFLKLAWFYEPEGYEVGRGVGWLPDFYLPERKLLVEAKAWKGEGLDKAAHFVLRTGRDVLISLPNGRFLLCSKYDWFALELGEKEPSHVPHALLANDWEAIDEAMKHRAVLAVNGHGARFTNLGEVSDGYCGWEPEFYNSVKDHDFNGREERTDYWAGSSTWEQRGFSPTDFRR